jgi:hypothetical protein
MVERSKSNIPFVSSPRGCDARIRRESGAYVTQMLRAKFTCDVRHVARVHHTNVARTNKGCYFWTLCVQMFHKNLFLPGTRLLKIILNMFRGKIVVLLITVSNSSQTSLEVDRVGDIIRVLAENCESFLWKNNTINLNETKLWISYLLNLLPKSAKHIRVCMISETRSFRGLVATYGFPIGGTTVTWMRKCTTT